MFDKITLKNFRTHKSTTIKLKPVTLFIGNNNSGKTNFLAGIQHFCNLVRRSHPESRDRTVKSADFYPHRYILAKDEDSMGFAIAWNHALGKIDYQIELYKNAEFAEHTGCKEKIKVEVFDTGISQEYSSGYNSPTNEMNLRTTLAANSNASDSEKTLIDSFFSAFANTFSYQLQSSFLKGLIPYRKIEIINDLKEASQADSDRQPRRVKHPADLGYEGGNFQDVILDVKQQEEQNYARFVALLRRFNNQFQGVRIQPEQNRLLWEFDLGKQTTEKLLDEFTSEAISDGLVKAAAISLLVSLSKPPALILLEEIENGINPGNIQELLHWIWQATSPNPDDCAPQFIITSHSPSVLREFHDRLDSVYTFRLDKRKYQSDVRNLNDVIDVFVGVGTVEGETTEDENGQRLVTIPKKELTELWYSGTIG
ncbi:MAG: ATP-binding protein [Oscillatoriaceae cyanobacterium Prado104]|jgi:predicted ATPase|nr:ATP-binding protein [Oscillatoriaceae cyanobacterium Prado104]